MNIRKVASIGIKGRDDVVRGAFYIADAVKRTLGPGGQNFIIEKGNRITNDGITIARELIGTQENELEERGAKAIIDASSKSNDEVGDGSTTVFVLAQAIIKEALKQLPSKDRLIGKMSPMNLIKKIDEERAEVTKLLDAMAEKIESEEQMIQVAKVSVEDDELATLIGKAQWELGPGGFILAEETNDLTSSIDRVNGILIDNGFGTQATVNNQEKEALELHGVHVIFTNYTVTSLEVFIPTIETLVKMGHRRVILMARAFTEDAIRDCLKNMEAGLHIYPLNAPYVDQPQIMDDLACVIGGRFLNSETSSLDALQMSDVGYATHVLAKRMSTVIAGAGVPERISNRVEELKKKREGSPSAFEKRNLDSRIAQLTNGFALLKVGATTDTERKYKKDKVDDAVNAVRAALQEGVVPGGGQALKTIAESLPDDYILKPALRAPYDQVRYNAGDDFVLEPWVKDSVKVTRVALEKACSVASVLSTVEGAIATKKPKECCNEKG